MRGSEGILNWISLIIVLARHWLFELGCFRASLLGLSVVTEIGVDLGQDIEGRDEAAAKAVRGLAVVSHRLLNS